MQSEWSVSSSYPSFTVPLNYTPTPVPTPIPPLITTRTGNKMYEFVFPDGKMAVSSGMMTRLCQEGHIFKMLLFGGNGYSNEVIDCPIHTLNYYGITKESFQALVFSFRFRFRYLRFRFYF